MSSAKRDRVTDRAKKGTVSGGRLRAEVQGGSMKKQRDGSAWSLKPTAGKFHAVMGASGTSSYLDDKAASEQSVVARRRSRPASRRAKRVLEAQYASIRRSGSGR